MPIETHRQTERKPTGDQQTQQSSRNKRNEEEAQVGPRHYETEDGDGLSELCKFSNKTWTYNKNEGSIYSFTSVFQWLYQFVQSTLSITSFFLLIYVHLTFFFNLSALFEGGKEWMTCSLNGTHSTGVQAPLDLIFLQDLTVIRKNIS